MLSGFRSLVVGGVYAAILVGFALTGRYPVFARDIANDKAGTLYDYMVMNVCVDQADRVTNQDPLNCPLSEQRNVRPGEAVPYFHSDYSPASLIKRYPCYESGVSRRYAFPLDISGTDQTGKSHPLIVSWTDFTPTATDCVWSIYDKRDSATILAVVGGYGSIMGSLSRGKYFACLGEGYTETATRGVTRFSKCWPFPEAIPPMNGKGGGVFFKKTRPLGRSGPEIEAFPAHDAGEKLARTIAWWTRMMVTYGPSDRPTKPLDSLIQFGFAQANAAGDAPGLSTGSERLYLTRELGYVTRWESWRKSDPGGEARTLAHRAYENKNCGAPANTEGQFSPHFSLGPVIEDSVNGWYSQVYTITNARSGERSADVWYMVGCHDYTNVKSQPPLTLNNVVTKRLLGRQFLTLFGVPNNELQ